MLETVYEYKEGTKTPPNTLRKCQNCKLIGQKNNVVRKFKCIEGNNSSDEVKNVYVKKTPKDKAINI